MSKKRNVVKQISESISEPLTRQSLTAEIRQKHFGFSQTRWNSATPFEEGKLKNLNCEARENRDVRDILNVCLTSHM